MKQDFFSSCIALTKNAADRKSERHNAFLFFFLQLNGTDTHLKKNLPRHEIIQEHRYEVGVDMISAGIIATFQKELQILHG